jgi:hypothetical protein
MDPRDFEYIREKVEDSMGFSMDSFGFDQIINITDDLSIEEKEWAKKHLSWSVNIEPPPPCGGKESPQYYEEVLLATSLT